MLQCIETHTLSLSPFLSMAPSHGADSESHHTSVTHYHEEPDVVAANGDVDIASGRMSKIDLCWMMVWEGGWVSRPSHTEWSGACACMHPYAQYSPLLFSVGYVLGRDHGWTSDNDDHARHESSNAYIHYDVLNCIV